MKPARKNLFIFYLLFAVFLFSLEIKQLKKGTESKKSAPFLFLWLIPIDIRRYDTNTACVPVYIRRVLPV